MKTQFVSEHFEITPAIRSHLESESAQLMGSLPVDSSIRIILDLAPEHQFRVTLCVHAWHREWVIKDISHDLYLSISEACRRMERQLDSHRKSLSSFHQRDRILNHIEN